MAVPDRWNTWLLGAIILGLRLIWRYRPAVIWSTYPIPTAHLAGAVLSRLTGIPWIADFRDPMVYMGWPPNDLQRKAYIWIENLVARYCCKAVFVTPGTMGLYRERYPELDQARTRLIPNGFDASDLSDLSQTAHAPRDQIFLLHSGLMEIPDRDPTSFFDALAELRRAGEISEHNVKIVLRASQQDTLFQKQIRERGIGEIVFLEPRIAHRDALAEMLSADGLLLFQGPTCNLQIPAKAYEYLAARKPIFLLADREGDTWRFLQDIGIKTLVPIDSTQEIIQGLRQFLVSIRNRSVELPHEDVLSKHSRAARARDLAALLDSVATTAR
jgi:hypothetical protein